jgi:hypothetical protein
VLFGKCTGPFAQARGSVTHPINSTETKH